MAIIFEFLLFLDGIVYNIIDWIYDIFNYLAGLNLFKESVYMDIVQRIYVILGMVMLFILAYTLLKAVVNPENFAKGEQSFPKLIQNVLVSLVIIVMLPTVFSVAYNVQNSILTYNTIPKLILGDDNANDYTKPDASNTFDNKQGKKMALYIFSSVFHENASWCDPGTISSKSFEVVGESDCAKEINGNGGWFVSNGDPLNTATANLKDGKADFTIYKTYSEAIQKGKIEYLPIVSTIIGIFTAYVLVNYCFDMALRVIKLMFFQIIAPVPVICRILPGGKMKDVFSDWMKKTISTFVEVFIRIAIIYLGVFLINEIVKEFPNLPNGGLSFTQLLVCKVLLIMGVVIFIRQAPKLISEMFHLDSGSMKLGIMDKLAMGGALTAGAAVGGAITGFGRNMVTAGKNVKNAKGFGGKAKALLSGAGSTIAGGMSAGARAGWTGKGAKNIGDVKTAAGKGATGAKDAKAKRDNYKARVNAARANGEMATGLGLRIKDKMDSAGQHFGFGSLDDLKKQQEVYQEGMGYKKDLFDLVSDNEAVLTYQGEKKAAQERSINEYMTQYGLSEYEAIQRKTADIKKYDDAIKLASLSAIHKKIQDKDGRFTAQLEKFRTWQSQHANVKGIAGLTLTDLSEAQASAIQSALSSNNGAEFKKVLDAFENSDSPMKLDIMSNDKAFKILNGNVQVEISKKMQEKKAAESK